MGVSTVVGTAALGYVTGATGGSPQNHLVYAKNTGRWWFFTWSSIAVSSGTATAGSTTSLTDSGASFGSKAHYVCYLSGGTGAGQIVEILSSTATVLTFNQTLQGAAPASGTTYEIWSSSSVHAYVSSSSDLSTATWSEATGSPTANVAASGTCIDLTGGKNDPGGSGLFPVDGRQLAVGYASISSVDVVQLFLQVQTHWQHYTLRGRLGIGTSSTVVWDTTGPTGDWTTGIPGDECPPSAPQGLSIAISSTNRWHGINAQNFADVVGMPATVIDDGTANKDPAWGGTRTTMDTGVTWSMYDSSVVPLASGFMLTVYTNGTYDGAVGAAAIHQAGLHWAESSSESLWPTTNVAAAVPNLSASSNDPQDWAIAAISATDIHVVRRDTGTVLEQVRYSGHSGSWGAKVTLPTSGLTGAMQGGGLALATDGTSLWCFVIDTDANHSIRYIKWSGSWASSWSTLSTDSTVKKFITVGLNTNGIGVAWTVGSATPFAVASSWLSLGAVAATPVPAVTHSWGFR